MKTTQKTLLALAISGVIVGSANTTKTNVYFGDTHIHTNNSVDAYAMKNTTLGPEQAYQFAQGQPVINPLTGAAHRLNTPLDYVVVADHAFYMGVNAYLYSGKSNVITDSPTGKRFIQMVKDGKGQEVFFEFIQSINNAKPIDDLNNMEVKRSIWHEVNAMADKYYQPNKFTTFVGWEWISLTDGANLHRVMFQSQDSTVGNKYVPYSTFDSDKVEDLYN